MSRCSRDSSWRSRQLLADGLVFVDCLQAASGTWLWAVTDRGRQVVESGDYEPDDPEGYLRRLRERIHNLDDLVALYAKEGLRAYRASCYLASAVMLGVASERAFQLLGDAFAAWLPETEAAKFRSTFDNPKRHYQTKFVEFRKRVESHKQELPPGFSDSMALSLDSVLDLLRINRNEAGHPTGRRIDRDDAYINLQMFACYVEKMFGLRDFFQAGAAEP